MAKESVLQLHRAKPQIRNMDPVWIQDKTAQVWLLENTELNFGKPSRIRHSKISPLPGYPLGRTATLKNPNTTKKDVRDKNHAMLRIRVHKMTIHISACESPAKTIHSIWKKMKELVIQ